MKILYTIILSTVFFIHALAQETTEDTTIYIVVDQAPLFPCKNTSKDFKEKQACAQKKMLEFVYTQIRYPKQARENGIQGTAIASFIVEKDGSISNITTLRAVGGGCDEEVIRIIQAMPRWEAGVHKGENVRVKFTLPVKFKIDQGKQQKKIEEPVYGALKMPMFPNDCQGNSIEKIECANDLFTKFITKHLEIESEIDETIIISFDVEEDGSFSEIVFKDTTNTQLNEAIIKVLEIMPKWHPAEYKEKVVKSSITISMRIKFDDLHKTIEIDDKLEIVETMPYFPNDCEGTLEEKRKCGNQALLQFIADNIQYPEIAKQEGIEGTVVVSFIVEKDGSVTNPKIIRSPGAGCGKEVLRLVSLMTEKWTPGTQRGQPVRVQFNLPVRFRLE